MIHTFDGLDLLALMAVAAAAAYGWWIRWDHRRREDRQLHLRVQRNLHRMSGGRT